MAPDEGIALGPELRKKLDAISRRRAEKAAEKKAAHKLLRRKIIGVLIKQASHSKRRPWCWSVRRTDSRSVRLVKRLFHSQK